MRSINSYQSRKNRRTFGSHRIFGLKKVKRPKCFAYQSKTFKQCIFGTLIEIKWLISKMAASVVTRTNRQVVMKEKLNLNKKNVQYGTFLNINIFNFNGMHLLPHWFKSFFHGSFFLLVEDMTSVTVDEHKFYSHKTSTNHSYAHGLYH
jgi:hypothetical protein